MSTQVIEACFIWSTRGDITAPYEIELID